MRPRGFDRSRWWHQPRGERAAKRRQSGRTHHHQERPVPLPAQMVQHAIHNLRAVWMRRALYGEGT